ncbi:MAG: hypothetical protein KatS3mg105_2488 [Gemmatales bacterium]|nr:MAG: hypothetical protein KatS3mg105_2488 [Gemmatales bacterium]
MTTGIYIGNRCNRQSGSMRCHVEAVCQKRHRSKDNSSRDLDDHHHAGQTNNNKCAGFAWSALVLTESVLMLPALQLMIMHTIPSSDGV